MQKILQNTAIKNFYWVFSDSSVILCGVGIFLSLDVAGFFCLLACFLLLVSFGILLFICLVFVFCPERLQMYINLRLILVQ